MIGGCTMSNKKGQFTPAQSGWSLHAVLWKMKKARSPQLNTHNTHIDTYNQSVCVSEPLGGWRSSMTGVGAAPEMCVIGASCPPGEAGRREWRWRFRLTKSKSHFLTWAPRKKSLLFLSLLPPQKANKTLWKLGKCFWNQFGSFTFIAFFSFLIRIVQTWKPFRDFL